ncbi:MAG: hypothetical protein KC912_10860 [Proteobacteria bacterium]|nr:hypothetical protein [Pseudomonadota bacterium]
MRLTPLLLIACATPGRFDDGQGVQALQTALYAIDVDAYGDPQMVLLLSNGAFACDFPLSEDPSELQAARAAIFAAACREDARHVKLTLHRDAGLEWAGTYDGTGVSTGSGRALVGSYYAVYEAALSVEDGLVRQFSVTEDEYVPGIITGTATVDDFEDGVSAGRFSLPNQRLAGRFRAAECNADDALFRLLALEGRLTCETD